MANKRFRFLIRINDDEDSLSSENGLPFEKLAELLANLFSAIDPHTNSKCTLSKIKDESYGIELLSEDEKYHYNLEVVHKNVEQIPIDELPPEQVQYAKSLKKILGGKYYLKAVNNDGKEIATIRSFEKTSVDFYYSTETIYGILSELGGITIDSNKKHIYIDGTGYRINISKDQDIQLKDFYGTHKLRVKVRHKRSATDGHIVSAEMLEFSVVEKTDLIDTLREVGYVDFELIKDAHTLDEIVNRIYGTK